MYEKLIQKLINRNVGDIGGIITPTGGTTACPVETGKFSNTYDGYTATSCCFKRSGTWLSEWYWDSPVNVTSFKILSLFYVMDSNIYLIWGRVNGSWVELWTGAWQPNHAYWDSKSVICNNCDGILIGQRHNPQPSRPCILEVSVGYDIIPEGKATIVSITKPSNFTPGVPFYINPKIRNDGGDDKLYLRIIDKDTGSELKHGYITLAAGKEYMPTWSMTLTQETDFRGKLEAGHIE